MNKKSSRKSRDFVFFCLCGLALTGIIMAAEAKENSNSGRPQPRRIIPPPIKDLGKAYKVRLVYFVPTDKEVKPNYREIAEVLMRVVADVYRREMKANGQRTRG
ncbi:MAG: hypothetical protein P8K78_09355, partial [Pirellulales bacterium]|nr:hypothetical protein [Pirellulales bacterium]